jgi:UDP-N-acetylglucosamine:LPS N-acetylglucosamine transferase
MRRRPTLVVLGEGGHTTEMLALVDDLASEHDLHYVVIDEDLLSAERIRRPGPVHRLPRPRAKDAGLVAAVMGTVRAQLRALALAMRVRPGAVLTTGPAIGVPVALATRLLGGEVVFVETISRVTAPSGTGRIMRRVADLYVVQWPQLAAAEAGAVYAGRLL